MLYNLISEQKIEEYEKTFKQHKEGFKQALLQKITLTLNSIITLERKSPDKPSGPLTNASRDLLKKKFTDFNTSFQELLSTNSQYVIPDRALKADIKDDIVFVVSQNYQRFYDKFVIIIALLLLLLLFHIYFISNSFSVYLRYAFEPFTTNYPKYRKYKPEEVKEQLASLFTQGSGIE